MFCGNQQQQYSSLVPLGGVSHMYQMVLCRIETTFMSSKIAASTREGGQIINIL